MLAPATEDAEQFWSDRQHQQFNDAAAAPRFAATSCSACGRSLGPGNAGVSHCSEHTGPVGDLARYHTALEQIADGATGRLDRDTELAEIAKRALGREA